VTTLKVFTAYNNRLRLQDGEIFQLMQIAAKYGFLTMLHAENGDVIDILVEEALKAGHTEPIWHARTRPSWGAVESVLRSAALAAQSNAPLYPAVLISWLTPGTVVCQLWVKPVRNICLSLKTSWKDQTAPNGSVHRQ